MPKHGVPDSVAKNLSIIFSKWLWGLLAAVVVAVSGSLAYGYWFAPRQAVQEDRAVEADKRAQDSQLNPPVKVAVSAPGKPWPAWVSPELLDVDASAVATYGFPGDEVAVHIGKPVDPAVLGDGYVSSIVSFDLTGLSNSATRLTSIKVVVDEQKAAPSGTLLYALPQGDSAKGDLGVDLGSEDLEVRAMYDGALGDASYLSERTVTIAKDESIGFQAYIFAPPNSDFLYHLEIAFDSGKKANVDNDGKPFRIVSFPDQPQRAYVPTMPTAEAPLGLHECRWKEGCKVSFNSLLRDSLPG